MNCEENGVWVRYIARVGRGKGGGRKVGELCKYQGTSFVWMWEWSGTTLDSVYEQLDSPAIDVQLATIIMSSTISNLKICFDINNVAVCIYKVDVS